MNTFTTLPSYSLLCSSVFVYPTETCYGLGCDATDVDLVSRIYAIKGRSFTKPVSLIVTDIEMAEQYAEFSKKARDLAEKFWPGALTLALPLRKDRRELADIVRSEFVGLRVSSHRIASAISRSLRRPIVATSANVSGKRECYSVSEVSAQFFHQKEKPDIIIDYGVLPRVPPTTIVKIAGDEVEIIRHGQVITSDLK